MRVLLATWLLAVPVAAAAPTPDVTRMAADDCARARKQNRTCVLTITDHETVDGRVPMAGDRPITALPGGTHASLVRVRAHFIPEILKSAEDL